MDKNTNPREELDRFYTINGYEPEYTQEQIKAAIPFAVKKLCEESYYAPLVERYPILVDEQVPKLQKHDIVVNKSCACTDANNVYVLTAEMAKHFKAMTDTFNDYDTDRNLIDNVAAILAHEYTHVLCQHKKIGNAMGKITKAEQRCFLLACEIEANRGDKVDISNNNWDTHHTMVYRSGVTDSDIPETKKDKYLPQIYATLLNMYKEQEQKFQQLLEQIKNNDMADAIEGGKKGKGTKNGKENKNTVQGESQTGTDTGEMVDDATDNDSVNRQQNGTGKEDKDDNESECEWEELTQEQIEASIKTLENETERAHDQRPGDETGIGLESPYVEYKPELTPKENLERNYERWHEKQVKKELAKMKGLIRGNISKNKEKTYARPTRRPITGSGGLIKKGVRYEKSYSPKVLIAMDSSGSMCSTTMKEVACAIENIFKDLGKPKTGSWICKHESNVSDVKPMRQWKEVVESYYPSGGNCFLHVLEKANELGVDVVLNIGDGQDTVYREYGGDGSAEINKFKNAGRQWFDVLVTNKNENRYYQEEAYYDEQKGFHREGIYLGDKITKYLGKAS